MQQLSNCIAREIENLRPRLPQGIPEMHFLKMEPLLVKQAALESGNDLTVNFYDMNIYGLTNFKLNNINFDIKNNLVRVDLNFDQLYGDADYKVKGKLLFLNLNGAGRVNGTYRKFGEKMCNWRYFCCLFFLDNTKVTATLKGKREAIKGKEYIIFDKIDIELDVLNGAEVYFDNLFENNVELTRATNQAINGNIRDILNELKPVVKKTVGGVVLSLVSTLFRRYSMDELFPEN